MMPSIVKLSVNTVRLVFFAFAGIMGISLSNIFLVYTSESVTGVFFMTASVFGAMSIYGNVTKKDLTSIGSFCMMGLIGVIIASVVNLFLASSALYFATSLISVFVFVGLTAYDVQNMKRVYMGAHGHASEDQVSKLSLSSALQLYMNFINLFLALLRLFGDRKN